MQYWGLIGDINLSQAFEWWLKAAENGYADAQFNLSIMYVEGIGIAKDDCKAVEWYQKAAEQGHIEAQFNLGGMYQFGIGIEKDARKAVEQY